ncbi:MAG TPA: hypothetical protein VFK79_14825 [Xanthobacteraceae bacterium]|nr:hypothetical protein [Xanthobacteraceae bacterium]
MNPITTLLSAAALSSVIATGASGQTGDVGDGRALTADVGRALVASNSLKLSADTLRSGSPATPFKQFIVPYAGVVRVTWQFRSDGTHTATAAITSNIHRCDASTMLATFQAKTCDLRVVAGDLVQAQAIGEFVNPGFSTAHIRQVRVYYNVVNATGVGKTLKN